MKRFTTFTILFAISIGCDQASETTTPSIPSKTATSNANEPAPTSVATSPVAVCELIAIGDSKIAGTIRFEQEGDTVQIRGTVTGLTPGKHAFHVHEHGDMSDKAHGKSAGGHFNPTGKNHGRQTDEDRHVGDLGNIEANAEGTAAISIDDTVVKLDGENSIVGRGLMIHAGEDMFTQPAGDAGDRVAFGIIKLEE